ncbi:MAG: tRNA pseudouridine(55) synthase TruB [candidate division WOR-3 bacterium]|nr:MAG: tRNA pseudouridine(55) synthase TruB [candidate division WOR-3 bacterium]
MRDDILLIDKPVGFSSFQIVRILKKRYQKVGHAGTLDPFASGLLIILIGRATKQFTAMQTRDKEYSGEMVLGRSTDTYDISGTWKQESCRVEDFTLDTLNEIGTRFTGEIEQIPPRFSALKVGGKKMYELSRKGTSVLARRRRVFVHSFTLTAINERMVRFNAVVGKGVYIRSLAHDFGISLHCGATLVSLRRTRIGEYDVSQAKKIGDLL